METQVAGTLAGTLERLPPLPNAGHQHLFNAENCTVSADGRVFITGSTAVYEVLPAAGGTDPENPRYEYREITITAPEIPPDCFRNGIATSGHYVYLACAHIHHAEKPGFPGARSALNAISQTRTLNFLRLWLAEAFERIDSYVVRADLRRETLRFDSCLKIQGDCFANGLAADQHDNLYLANSVPLNSCIYKIVWSGDDKPQHPEQSVWFKMLTRQLVNGIKCEGDSVYYTCMPLPIWSRVERLDLDSGKASETELIYSTIGLVDDFDIAPGCLVLANGSDISGFADISRLRHGVPNGSLIFISRTGKLFGVFNDERLIHPSSVKVVDRDLEWCARGDVLITDKGADGEFVAFLFTPDDACRSLITGDLA